jgi:hypothetical protein
MLFVKPRRPLAQKQPRCPDGGNARSRRTHDVRVMLWLIPEVKGRRRIRNWLDLH